MAGGSSLIQLASARAAGADGPLTRWLLHQHFCCLVCLGFSSSLRGVSLSRAILVVWASRDIADLE